MDETTALELRYLVRSEGPLWQGVLRHPKREWGSFLLLLERGYVRVDTDGFHATYEGREFVRRTFESAA